MSTRCSVFVNGFQLYHHYDGYPEFMLDVIARAWRASTHHYRVGDPVARLCAADPDIFEVELGEADHGDLEWTYRVRPSFASEPVRTGTNLVWTVEVQHRVPGGEWRSAGTAEFRRGKCTASTVRGSGGRPLGMDARTGSTSMGRRMRMGEA